MTDAATNIANLEAALAGGELRVEVNGEMVIYKSNAQLLQALSYFKTQAGAAPSTFNPAPSVTLATFGNG